VIDWLQALLLAAIQGLTEFLPISSSAHLVIPSLVLDWPDQGLAFDIAVHVGTLMAVLVYYRSDLWQMATGCLDAVQYREQNPQTQMVFLLAVASVPVALVGFTGSSFIEENLRTLPVIATTTAVFGILLGVADRYSTRVEGSTGLTLPIALAIGFAQAIAPIPGVSRSGVTITAGLFLKLDRQTAARFSFLLSIPVIGFAGLVKGLELATSEQPVEWAILLLGAVAAAVTAYLCIAAFIRLLDRIGMMPFVYYRLVLAAFLFWIWIA